MSRHDAREEFLRLARGFELLGRCDEDALLQLAQLAICHQYPRNNFLLYQGDPAGFVYLVLSGRVKLALTNEEGKEVIVALVEPGELFGLCAALDAGSQPFNAVTSVPSQLAKFQGPRFLAWLERQQGSQRRLLQLLVKRMRHAYQKIGEHALMGVKDRLLYTLLEIAEREGERDPHGTSIVFERPTHQELAYRIGSSREVVTRVLKELLESDLLQAEGRVIRVSSATLVLREE